VSDLEIKFVYVTCLWKWNRQVRCERACSVCFPDTPDCRDAGRKMLAAVRDACPMRGIMAGKVPVFDDPIKVKRQEMQHEYSGEKRK
jgi:hypothetical protein